VNEEKHYACYWSLVTWGTSWGHHPAVPFQCHLALLLTSGPMLLDTLSPRGSVRGVLSNDAQAAHELGRAGAWYGLVGPSVEHIVVAWAPTSVLSCASEERIDLVVEAVVGRKAHQ
jgi:hypothetical protein